MKIKLHYFLALLLPLPMLAQQDDIGQTSTIRGFVQNIDYDKKLLLVNYIDGSSIEMEVIQLEGTVFLNEKKAAISINDIKSNDEVVIIEDRFKERKYNVAKEVKQLNKKINADRYGRLDNINGEVAIVDGFRFKLKPGKKIKGLKKSGYDGKTFNAFTDLKLGDLAEIEGDLEGNDFALATAVTIEPDLDDTFDHEAQKIDKDNYEKWYPLWTDKSKRALLFGTTVEGVGRVLNDALIQDYVEEVAQKLIPPHLKKRTSFLFIVVENPEPTANIRANGLAFVYTGLLKVLDNEAQLAAALGHEIAHVLYKHNADKLFNTSSASKNKENIKKKDNIFSNAYDAVKENTSKALKEDMGLDSKTTKILDGLDSANRSKTATKFKEAYIDKRKSKWSVGYELQADRVGLALMVLSGYDPREAPLVWKNMIINYEAEAKAKEEVTLASTVAKELEKDPKKKDPKGKKPATAVKKTKEPATKEEPEETTLQEDSTLDKAGSLFLNWRTEDNTAKSIKTHPDEVRRFEEINRLVSVLWDDPELLKNSQNGAKKYKAIKKRLKSGKGKGKK